MTTIICGCPSEDAFTPKQATLLANIYQEPEWITDDGLEMENWDDKLIITTADEIDITGFAEEDMVPYADALKLIENEPKSKPQHPTRIAPDVIQASRAESGMTVTDGIDLVALLIENDLCSDDTPEHIKADLRVLAQIIKLLQSSYPFTASDEITDIAHRQYAAEMETRSMCDLIFVISRDIRNGKFHTARTTEQAEAQS